MGLIRDGIGQLLGSDKVQNGFGGPKLPSMMRRDNDRQNNVTMYSRQEWDRRDYGQQSTYRPQGQDERYWDDRRQQFNTDQPPAYEDDSNYRNDHAYNYSSQGDRDRQRQEHRSDTYMNGHASYPMEETRIQNSVDQSSYYQNQAVQSSYYPNQASVQDRGFRPLALPQIDYGDGKPFLRAYSNELIRHGISEKEFIGILDAVNVAVIPNPEVQIFQKGASIAGWFIPGSASIGLMAGQVGVGVAAAMGHSSLVNKILSEANLRTFLPHDLEMCIGKTKNLDEELGLRTTTRSTDLYGASPIDRQRYYDGMIAHLSVVLPDLETRGRRDPLAMLANGIISRSNQKKYSKAQEDMQKGDSKKAASLENGFKWLIVRKASPMARQNWQQTLQQSDVEIAKLQTDAQRTGHSLSKA